MATDMVVFHPNATETKHHRENCYPTFVFVDGS